MEREREREKFAPVQSQVFSRTLIDEVGKKQKPRVTAYILCRKITSKRRSTVDFLVELNVFVTQHGLRIRKS